MDSQMQVVPPPRLVARLLRDPRAWLVAYSAALALIAFWPVPVDRGAGPALALITRLVPWITYPVMEFTANILLFVPLGVLLTLILHRRWAVLPIALAVTLGIEIGQALLLSQRTPAVSDVIANLLGAAIGMLGVIAVTAIRRARAEAR